MHNRINVSEKNVKTQGHKNKNQKRFHHIVKRFALTKNCGFSSFLFYCCGNQRNFSSKITFYPCLLLRKSFLYQKCIVVTKQNRRLDFRPFQYFLQLSCSFRSTVKILFVNLIGRFLLCRIAKRIYFIGFA